MLDENLIATLEQSLRQTRNAQSRLMARLREVEFESERLREEIDALENSASQTESAIDSLLVTMRSGSRRLRNEMSGSAQDEPVKRVPRSVPNSGEDDARRTPSPYTSSVSYFAPNRGVPSRTQNIEPLSHRFAAVSYTHLTLPTILRV